LIVLPQRNEDKIKALNDDLLPKNAKLDLASKDLESFVYSVSHDLRAPLRHISWFADSIIKDIGANSMRKERDIFLASMIIQKR
jgi:light-regulated signal transduction histidine kinase (bacteriophytochrome)